VTGSSWPISDIIWTLETAGSLRMFVACSACPSVNCSDKNQNHAVQRSIIYVFAFEGAPSAVPNLKETWREPDGMLSWEGMGFQLSPIPYLPRVG